MADNSTKIVLTAEDRTGPAFQSATRGLSDMQRQALNAASALSAIGFTAAAASAVAFVRSVATAADDMAKLSQRVGISARELGQWQLAADLSGASIESVAKGVKGLSTFLKEHGDRLKSAGIDTRDTSTALIQLSDIFAGMPDGLQKTALATELFGKAGLDLIPMLNLGAKGLEETRAKADEYGKRMAEIAPDSERFNDALTELGFQARTAGLNLGNYLIPGLAGAAQLMNDLAAGGQRAKTAIEALKSSDSAILKNMGALGDVGLRARQALGIDKPVSGWELAGMDPVTGRALGTQTGGAASPWGSDAAFMARQQASALLGTSGSAKTAKPAKWAQSPDFLAWQQAQRAGESQLSAKEIMAQLHAEDAELNRMLQIGENNQLATYFEEAGEETMRLVAAQRELKNASKDAFSDMTRAIDNWGNKAADTFADFVVTGKASFSDLVNSIGTDLVRMQAKKLFDPVLSQAGDWITKTLGSLFPNADGGVYASPSLHAHANSVVSSPTLFKFAKGGSFGLMGEAGPEAIMPLKRGSDGKLGVAASGGSVVVNVIEAPGQGGQVRQRQDGGQNIVEVLVDRVKSSVAADIVRGTGAVPGALASAYGLNRVAGAY